MVAPALKSHHSGVRLSPSKYQILQGKYVATFFVSRDPAPIHHAIITTHDSPEIVSWTQCTTAEECEQNAIRTLRALNGKDAGNLLLFPPIPRANLRRISNKKKRKSKAARKSG
jgi:hypothetical protein